MYLTKLMSILIIVCHFSHFVKNNISMCVLGTLKNSLTYAFNPALMKYFLTGGEFTLRITGVYFFFFFTECLCYKLLQRC